MYMKTEEQRWFSFACLCNAELTMICRGEVRCRI